MINILNINDPFYLLFPAALESQPIKVAALGRPLFPGMLYDCRKDTFIPGALQT